VNAREVAAPKVGGRAYAWARRRILDDLARQVGSDSRRAFGDHEELSCAIDGRACRVTLWTARAEVDVTLSRPVLPAALRIEESSVWGPQKQEAWIAGAAAETGDLEFDLEFMVLAAAPTDRPSPHAARAIPAAVRSALRDERRQGGLRDAEIRPDRVILSVAAAPERRAAMRGRGGIAWALGVAFLGFDRMPSAPELTAAVARAVRLAEALERAATTVQQT